MPPAANPTTCGHPQRKNEALGMCKACYRRQHRLRPGNKEYLNAQQREYNRKNAPNRACSWCGNDIPYGHQLRRFCSTQCRRLSQRNTILQREYGITLDDYHNMLVAQDGRCALCRRKSKLTLAVEHSHITGTVRGLCCMTCNRDVIGPLDGDTDRIQTAITFLTKMKDDLDQYEALHMQAPTPAAPAPQRRLPPIKVIP